MSLLLALTASGGPPSGVISWTEQNDVLAAAGEVLATTSLAWTEQDDVVSITGSVTSSAPVTCSAAWTEENDSFAISGISLAVDTKQGGLHGLKAQFRKTETEEQKLLRREAQGIIKRIKKAEPQEAAQLIDESADISRQLQEAITAFNQAAARYQVQLEEKEAQRAQEQAQMLQLLLIDAQLQAEQLQQQVEELDVAYMMMMLAAHV
jgi:hypothetical protein